MLTTSREHATRAHAEAFVAGALRLSDEVLLTEYAAAIGEAVPADEWSLSRLVSRVRGSMRDALECPCCCGTGDAELTLDDEDGRPCECDECEGTGVRCGSDPRWVVMPDGSEREVEVGRVR